MSSIDLIIIGYLAGSEKSAYDIVKEFDTWDMHNWIKVSSPSIYKNIIKLAEKGYLNSRVIKEGEMPEKTLYSINENGTAYFHELMKHFATEIGGLYLDFSAFLVNLHHLETDERSELLENFSEQLKLKNEHVGSAQKKDHEHPIDAVRLISLYRDIFDLIYKWSLELKENY